MSIVPLHAGLAGDLEVWLTSDDALEIPIPIVTEATYPDHIVHHSVQLEEGLQRPLQAPPARVAPIPPPTPAGAENEAQKPEANPAESFAAAIGGEESPEAGAFAAEPELQNVQAEKEDTSRQETDCRAAAIQQALRKHPKLTLTAALGETCLFLKTWLEWYCRVHAYTTDSGVDF